MIDWIFHSNESYDKSLTAELFDTTLGSMIAISDCECIYLLEFLDSKWLERKINALKVNCKALITLGNTDVIGSIKDELTSYFNGTLKCFNTPVHVLGSPFQHLTWNELRNIGYGQTRAYSTQAAAIGMINSVRAVANANSANPITIVIPCHRVINKDGNICGYSGGIKRKQWLLTHEQNNC